MRKPVAKLICVFIFAYTKIRFSHDAADIVKLVHSGVCRGIHYFSYFCSKNKDCGDSLEPPH